MVRVLLWVWQLPQNLLGLLWLIYLGCSRRLVFDFSNHGVTSYIQDFKGSVSLGEYRFVQQSLFNNVMYKITLHEYGHTLQSRMLGPLYLIVIGLPSILHLLVHRFFGRKWDYYNFWTERWANKLAGLK